MFFIYLIIVLFSVFFLAGTVRELYARKSYGMSVLSARTYSYPSRRLIKLNRSLPKDYQLEGLEDALEALDTKFEKARVNAHYRRSDYDSSYFSWSCQCGHWHSENCSMIQYRTLFDEITGLHDDLAEQAKNLELMGIQHRLDVVDSLVETARERRGIVKEVTKELT